ncbi:MAG: hypothetical protein QM759_06340 [Terricaulis sp.]
MRSSIAFIAAALALAACGPNNAAKTETPAAPLDAPSADTNPARTYTPASDPARATTGALTMTIATRLPDASAANADTQETLTLHGANGLNVDAQVTSTVPLATQVQGQTLRALLALPVDAQEVLVYHVTAETKPAGGQGLCGADATQYVVEWEPSDPGATDMKIMGVSGGAPGGASARACPMLQYQRS